MVEPLVERRLAAILCADVVGYSRLIGQDEAGTLSALKRLRNDVIGPILTRHRGRVVKTTGDGSLVEFGSVVDAVLCAAALQEAVADCQAASPPERRLLLRIGINVLSRCWQLFFAEARAMPGWRMTVDESRRYLPRNSPMGCRGSR